MTSPKEQIFGPFEKANFSRTLGPFENVIISGMNFKFGIYNLLKPLQVELKNHIEKLLPEVKLLSIKYMNDKFSDEELKTELKVIIMKFFEDVIYEDEGDDE